LLHSAATLNSTCLSALQRRVQAGADRLLPASTAVRAADHTHLAARICCQYTDAAMGRSTPRSRAFFLIGYYFYLKHPRNGLGWKIRQLLLNVAKRAAVGDRCRRGDALDIIVIGSRLGDLQKPRPLLLATILQLFCGCSIGQGVHVTWLI
jgi:hypothetical protein